MTTNPNKNQTPRQKATRQKSRSGKPSSLDNSKIEITTLDMKRVLSTEEQEDELLEQNVAALQRHMATLGSQNNMALFEPPDRQVERLETVARQLTETMERVDKAVSAYDDELLTLVDTEESTFDQKTVMQESKGKVKVLIVDYEKLCMDREQCLDSLRAWFEMGSLDEVESHEQDIANENANATAVTDALHGVRLAKDKLKTFHEDIIDDYENRIYKLKEQNRALMSGVVNEGERKEYLENIAKLSVDIEESNMKLSDLTVRHAGLQKSYDNKVEELNFYKLTDSSKTGQLKEELYQSQTKSKEKEISLLAQIDDYESKTKSLNEQISILNDQLVLLEKKSDLSEAFADLREQVRAEKERSNIAETNLKNANEKIDKLEETISQNETRLKEMSEEQKESVQKTIEDTMFAANIHLEQMLSKAKEDEQARITEIENKKAKEMENLIKRFTSTVKSANQFDGSGNENTNTIVETLRSHYEQLLSSQNEKTEVLKRENMKLRMNSENERMKRMTDRRERDKEKEREKERENKRIKSEEREARAKYEKALIQAETNVTDNLEKAKEEIISLRKELLDVNYNHGQTTKKVERLESQYNAVKETLLRLQENNAELAVFATTKDNATDSIVENERVITKIEREKVFVPESSDRLREEFISLTQQLHVETQRRKILQNEIDKMQHSHTLISVAAQMDGNVTRSESELQILQKEFQILIEKKKAELVEQENVNESEIMNDPQIKEMEDKITFVKEKLEKQRQELFSVIEENVELKENLFSATENVIQEETELRVSDQEIVQNLRARIQEMEIKNANLERLLIKFMKKTKLDLSEIDEDIGEDEDEDIKNKNENISDNLTERDMQLKSIEKVTLSAKTLSARTLSARTKQSSKSSQHEIEEIENEAFERVSVKHEAEKSKEIVNYLASSQSNSFKQKLLKENEIALKNRAQLIVDGILSENEIDNANVVFDELSGEQMVIKRVVRKVMTKKVKQKKTETEVTDLSHSLMDITEQPQKEKTEQLQKEKTEQQKEKIEQQLISKTESSQRIDSEPSPDEDDDYEEIEIVEEYLLKPGEELSDLDEIERKKRKLSTYSLKNGIETEIVPNFQTEINAETVAENKTQRQVHTEKEVVNFGDLLERQRRVFEQKMIKLSNRNNEMDDKIHNLEKRIAKLALSNEKLRLLNTSLRNNATETIIENETDYDNELKDLMELDVHDWAHHCLEMRKNNHRMEIELVYMRKQLESETILKEASEKKQNELEGLVDTLGWRVSLLSSTSGEDAEMRKRFADEEIATKMRIEHETFEMQIQKYATKIVQLETENSLFMTKENERITSAIEKALFESEQKHTLIVNEYESRIADLVSKLYSSKYNDPELLNALKRENEIQIKNMRLQFEIEKKQIQRALKVDTESEQNDLVSQRTQLTLIKIFEDSNERLKAQFEHFCAIQNQHLVVGFPKLNDEYECFKLNEKAEEETQRRKIVNLSRDINAQNAEAQIEARESQTESIITQTEKSEEEENTASAFETLLRNTMKAIQVQYDIFADEIKRREFVIRKIVEERDHQYGKFVSETEVLQKEMIISAERIKTLEESLASMKNKISQTEFSNQMSLNEIESEKRELNNTVQLLERQRENQQKRLGDERAKLNLLENDLYKAKLELAEKEEYIRTLLKRLESYESGNYKASKDAKENTDVFNGLTKSIRDFTANATIEALDEESAKEIQSLLLAAQAKGLVNPEIIENLQSGDESLMVNELLVMDTHGLDEQGRRKRLEALKLFDDEHTVFGYKSKRTQLEFLKLRERCRLKDIQNRMQAQSGTNLSFLQRMEQRTRLALVTWEKKKRMLLDERKNRLIQVLSVFSEVVLQYNKPKIIKEKEKEKEKEPKLDINLLAKQLQTPKILLPKAETHVESTDANQKKAVSFQPNVSESSDFVPSVSPNVTENPEAELDSVVPWPLSTQTHTRSAVPMVSTLARKGPLKGIYSPRKDTSFEETEQGIAGRKATVSSLQTQRQPFVSVNRTELNPNPRLVSLLGAAKPDLVLQPLQGYGLKEKVKDDTELLKELTQKGSFDFEKLMQITSGQKQHEVRRRRPEEQTRNVKQTIAGSDLPGTKTTQKRSSAEPQKQKAPILNEERTPRAQSSLQELHQQIKR